MDAPRTVGPPDIGVLGVGPGVVTETTDTQLHVALVVQDAFRQVPSTHTSPEAQFALTVQALLQDAGGIGVGVAVGLT